VDLNPVGFTFTQAQDVSGTSQVGFGGGEATGCDRHFKNVAPGEGTGIRIL
jgi:hypothetical protein